jgi:hypothetical protein
MHIESCGPVNATTQGVKQAFKKLEAKRRRQTPRLFAVARRWPAADQRGRNGGDIKSLQSHNILLDAGVAELADAQDLKSCFAKAECGFDPRPRHHSLGIRDLFGRGAFTEPPETAD